MNEYSHLRRGELEVNRATVAAMIAEYEGVYGEDETLQQICEDAKKSIHLSEYHASDWMKSLVRNFVFHHQNDPGFKYRIDNFSLFKQNE